MQKRKQRTTFDQIIRTNIEWYTHAHIHMVLFARPNPSIHLHDNVDDADYFQPVSSLTDAKLHRFSWTGLVVHISALFSISHVNKKYKPTQSLFNLLFVKCLVRIGFSCPCKSHKSSVGPFTSGQSALLYKIWSRCRWICIYTIVVCVCVCVTIIKNQRDPLCHLEISRTPCHPMLNKTTRWVCFVYTMYINIIHT